MLIKQKILIFFLSYSLFFVACSKKSTYPIEFPKQNIAMDLVTLSSDDMEGREIGTEGERKAGDYIAKRFSQIGLQPAGDNKTYFQTFTRKKNKNPHGDEPSDSGPVVKGRNVMAYIDNQSKYTVVIGGHYDHLGYGEEGSLYTGDRAIHNGADDNSSGVAGVLSLAESLKKTKSLRYNYLFVCFSGEEKGLWGSNYFIHNNSIDKNTINYMLNMDMIGRLNNERKLAISGIGTSPLFESIIDKISSPKFNLKKELSGMGPSDHASFYNADIPVLAFFTGQHSDYHKPSDDQHLINYSGLTDIVEYIYKVIISLDKTEKLVFNKTKDESQNRTSFSVTLGVMPDYMYDGKGMKIDGVKDGKAAELAGIQKGDIVIKMGDMDVSDMQTYMKCLAVFKPGQTVDVTVIHDGKEIIKKVTF